MGACGAKLDVNEESSEYDSDDYEIEDNNASSTRKRSPSSNTFRRKSAAFTNPVRDDEIDDIINGRDRDGSPVSVTDSVSSQVNPLENQRLIQKVYEPQKQQPPKFSTPDDILTLLKTFYALCDPTIEDAKIRKQVAKYHGNCKGLKK